MRHSFLVIAVIFLVGGVFGLLYLKRPVDSALPSTPVIPIPTATPEPTPMVKEVGEDRWKVTLINSKWFDTKIPVIANQRVMIENATEGGRWIAAIGRAKVFSGELPNPAPLMFLTMDTNVESTHWVVDANFRQVIRLALDDEGNATELVLYVSITDADPNSLGITLTKEQATEINAAVDWAEKLKQRLAR